MIIDSFENKEKILLSFLENSKSEGWNNDCLIHSFRLCEIDEKYLTILFPEGILSLVDFQVDYFNDKALAEIAKIENFHQLKLRDKIKQMVYLRFYVEINNQLALKRSINYFINYQNFTQVNIGFRPINTAIKSCYKIADKLWYSSNDSSIDFNFYSKRIILSKILLRCFFTFVNDDQELTKTKKLLDIEIQRVMSFGKFKHQFSKNCHQIKNQFEKILFDYDDNYDKLKIKNPKEVLKSLPFIRLFKF